MKRVMYMLTIVLSAILATGSVYAADLVEVTKAIKMRCAETWIDETSFTAVPTINGQTDTAVADVSVDAKKRINIKAKTDGITYITVRGNYGGTPSIVTYFVAVQTIALEKTVKTAIQEGQLADTSNATIRVVSHVLKNKKDATTPNVLFLGTRCSYHGLTDTTIETSLNELAKIANVDWYLFGNYNDADMDGASQNGLWARGSWMTNQTITTGGRIMKDGSITTTQTGTKGDVFSLDKSKHYSLKSMLTWLDKILDSLATSGKYDYVVIETDGGRLASEYGVSDRAGGTSAIDQAQELRVAKWLLPFYQLTNVIWVVDNGYDFVKGKYSPTQPLVSNGYVKNVENNTAGVTTDATKLFAYGYSTEADTDQDYGLYRPSNLTAKNGNNGNNKKNKEYLEPLSDSQWHGLLSVMDPALYIASSPAFTKDYVVANKGVVVFTDSDKTKTSNLVSKAAHEYTNQIWYDNASELSSYLRGKIKSVQYSAEIVDQIYDKDGALKILGGAVGVNYYEWPTNRVAGWKSPEEMTNLLNVTSLADLPKASGANSWQPVSKSFISVNDGVVTGMVDNIMIEWWNLIEIKVCDVDNFFKVCRENGRYVTNTIDGVTTYAADPNDGPAEVSLYRGFSVGRFLVAQTNQTTTILWSDPYNKQFAVSARDVEKTYDTYPTNIVIAAVKDSETKEPVTGYVVSNSYDAITWVLEKDFGGYVNATNKAPVYFSISKEGYDTYYGTNYVTILPIPMTIGPGPNGNDPIVQPSSGSDPLPPAEPGYTVTNGAMNAVKEYDGLPTNIIVYADNPKAAKVQYRYPNEDASTWHDADDFAGYTDVTNAAVWYKVTYPNYIPVTNCAFVTIKPRTLDGDGKDPEATRMGVVADSTSIKVGGTPTLTYKGPKGLANGDGVKSVDLALTNGVIASTLAANVYQDIISTNAHPTGTSAIVITNATGDVTKNYAISFYPGTLTVQNSDLTVSSKDVEKVYDGMATNIVIEVPPEYAGAAISTRNVGADVWIDYDPAAGYTYVADSTNVEFKVECFGYNTQYGTNSVTITPRKLDGKNAGLVANDQTIVYGNTFVNGDARLTYTGPNGLVQGDGLKDVSFYCTNTTWDVNTYPNAIVTNALFTVTNATGDVTKNYAITVYPGSLTINPAAINPPNDNPAPLSPDDPEPTIKPEDGPRAWGRSVAKEYDGLGTNIIVKAANITGGYTVRYAVTKDGPYYDDLQFTNVTYGTDGNLGPTNVYFEVRGKTADNYIALTNKASVTITPRTINDPANPDDPNDPCYNRSAVRANDTNMVYAVAGRSAAPETSYRGGKGLMGGDYIDLTPDYANTVWEQGTYTDVITTNATHKLIIRNANGDDVTANYVVAFYPGTLTIGKKGLNNDDPNADDAGVIAQPTNMVYGTPGPATTDLVWKGLKGLEVGHHAIVELGYATNAARATLDVGTYANLITTNAIIKIFDDHDNDVTANYDIAFFRANLTVTPATINPPNDNPAPLGPNDPEPTIKPEDGPRAWGRSVVKEYDGLGTNIIVKAANITGGYTVRYAVTKDGPYYDDLQFTNVTYGTDGNLGPTNVYFEVRGKAANNYLALTNYATITIVPAPMTIGPGEDGVPIVQPSYDEPPIPPADPDNKESWTNGAKSVLKVYDGLPTNIIVEVVMPTDNYTIEYSSDRENWYSYSDFMDNTNTQIIVPTNNACVWYKVEAPNYIPVTNCAFVTIGELRREVKGNDAENMPPEFLTQTTNDLNEIVKEKYKGYVFTEVQLSLTAISNLTYEAKENYGPTWIGPTDATTQTNAMLAAATDKFGPIAHFKFVDIVLEMTHDFAVAQANTYNNSNAWENIGNDNTKLIHVSFPYQLPDNMRIACVCRYHDDGGDPVKFLSESANGEEDTYQYNKESGSITVVARKYSIYGVMAVAPTPKLKASVRWAYCQATDSFFGQLRVACTNGDAKLIQKVGFAFQDRDNAYLWDWTNRVAVAQSNLYGNTTFRYADTDNNFLSTIRTANQDTEVIYGISDADWNKYVVPAKNIVPKSSRKFSLWATSRTNALDAVDSKSDLANYLGECLGYLIWKVEGEQGEYWSTIGSDAAQFGNKGNPILKTTSSTSVMPPLSVRCANQTLALGVVVTDDSAPELRITAFDVGAATIDGRIESVVGDQVGVPSASAKVTLLGSANIIGPYEEIETVCVDGNGCFTVNKPDGVNFFRVRLEVVDIVK